MKKTDLKIMIFTVMAVLLIIAMLHCGCSSSRSNSRKRNGFRKPSTNTPLQDEIEIESVTAPGDNKLLNSDLPTENADASGNINSIYYTALNSNATDANDFMPDGWDSSTSEVPSASETPETQPESPVTPVPSKTEAVSSPAVQSNDNDLKSQLKEAMAQKNTAFERYTRLATEGGSGDVQEALREYRKAYARVKALEAEIAGGR